LPLASFLTALSRVRTEIAPIVERVGVFGLTVADVRAVIHVGDHDVFNAQVDLGLGLHHGLARADDDEYDTRRAFDEPLAIDLFCIFNVDSVEAGPIEDNRAVLGEGFAGGFAVEEERRDDDVGPLGVALLFFGFGDETVRDAALLLGFNEIADVVTFLEYLIGDVSNEIGEQN